jgi:transcriptional regulator with XRE-family HTH domain
MLVHPKLSPLAANRRALGITQEALARYAGIDASHLSRIENGQRQSGRTTQEHLAAALGCSVDTIFPDRLGDRSR